MFVLKISGSKSFIFIALSLLIYLLKSNAGAQVLGMNMTNNQKNNTIINSNNITNTSNSALPSSDPAWYVKYRNNSMSYNQIFYSFCFERFNNSKYYPLRTQTHFTQQEENEINLYKGFFRYTGGESDTLYLKTYYDDVLLLQNNSQEDESLINKVKAMLTSLSFLLLFLIFNIVGNIICCSCAWYDYCPIFCKWDRKYLMSIRYVPLLINIFCGLNTIIPIISGFQNFK